MDEPKYPDLQVELTGSDGNAFAILGKVKQAMRRHGIDKTEIEEFFNEATSGDYDHLLVTCMKWVDVV